MTEQVAFLIAHAHLFTMRGEGVGYVADGAVAVRGDQIVAVGASGELLARFQAAETIDASDCAVLPGLIDAHMHTPLAIVRGVAQDVRHWMQLALAPYSRHITLKAARAGSRLNVLEALKAGTTTHVDYTRPFPGWAAFFDEVGNGEAIFGEANMAQYQNSLADIRAYDFDHVTAQAATGQTPTANVGAVDYVFEQLGTWL